MRDTKNENYIFTVAMVVLMGIIALTFLVGCKTRERVVTETIITHDTLLMHRIDTVRDVRELHVHDTLRQAESHVLTLGASGDTIKEVHIYHDFSKTTIIDSTQRYQAKMDSLLRIVDSRDRKEVVKVEKSIQPWKDVLWTVVSIVAIGLFVLVLRKRLGTL